MERPSFYRLPRGCLVRPGSTGDEERRRRRHTVHFPAQVAKVCLGSPSEGELHRGDVLLRIGDRDVTRLTHQEAHDLIRCAGNHLSLLLHRIPGAPGSVTPLSPGPSGVPLGQHPLAVTCSTMFQPLPTTSFDRRHLPFTQEPQALDDYERYENTTENRREKQAIVHQAYRTTPLIAPKAKSRHDLPMGSYLRHVQDPNWQKQVHSGATPVTNFNVRRKLEEAARSGATPPPGVVLGHSGNKDDPVPVFHRQYNSPINMYSSQAVSETMTGQSGLQPSSHGPGSLLQKRSTRKHVFQDISQSPTYQMIHDGEWNNLKKSQLHEHRPVEDRVYNAPVGGEENYTVNALGVPRGKILQSGSFNTLRTSLILGHSDF